MYGIDLGSPGRGVGRLAWVVCAGLLVGVSAAPVAGQGEEARVGVERSRFSGSVALLNTQPLGELRTGPGVGIGASAAWALDPAHRFRIRGEFRGAMYGSEHRDACLGGVGCLIRLDVSTNYGSLYLGAGPELSLPIGGAELVLDATAGLGAFSVSSSVRGISDSDSESLLETENFSDEFFAWSLGGEARFPVSRQLAVTLGAHYQHNGEASYVPEGGIVQNPDGSLDIQSLTTEANQVALTLGIAFRPMVGWADSDDD